MATSLRQVAACIGLESNFSVLREFYGFWNGVIPKVTGTSHYVSLLEHVSGLRGSHLHLNIIQVGTIVVIDDAVIDAAVHFCRSVFATVGIGVGRVRRFVISQADAAGSDVIDSTKEKQDLLGRWSVGGGGVDIFMVRDFTYGDVVGSAGYIPTNCGDEPSSEQDGVAVDVSRSAADVARTFAHELGHFLGLEHPCGDYPGCGDVNGTACDTGNLMTQSGCGTGFTLSISQGTTMRCHYLIQQGC